MKKFKPTSPGRRQMTGYDFSNLSKVAPLKSLIKGFKENAGRNNQGRITGPRKGGGAKRLYRLIDFKQNKLNVPAKVLTIEYDPNRTTRIALVVYKDGEKGYILAPQDLKVGDEIMTFPNVGPTKIGNRMPLKYIPQGTLVHNIELRPGQGGKIVRSAGSAALVLASEGGYVQLKMPSGEQRLVKDSNMASIGQLSNMEHMNIVIGKAGRSRHLGIRPNVRASVMNPVDHPYGGGEQRQGRGTRRPKTAHGKITGGRKTRNKKKKSTKFIIKRRK